MSVQIIKKAVKHINIKVRPTGEVILTAPLQTEDAHIDFILAKRADWIAQKLDFYKMNQPAQAKEYVSGENIRYLGRNYRLKVIQSDEESVKLQRAYLHLFVKDKSDLERKKKLVKAWYKSRAKIHFHKALLKYQPLVKKEVATVTIREMKTRWGSCHPSKAYINLNSSLICKLTECIEYVVLHELAHLEHPNHSKQFYNYMSLHMPDWKRRKMKLERRD